MSGVRGWVRDPRSSVRFTALRCLLCAAVPLAGCNDEEIRRLEPQLVGMSDALAPSYEDDEISVYEVRLEVALPVVRYSDAQRDQLRERRIAPFPRYPWVTREDVRVQIAWTISNLDADAHNVALLVDPWNEFARYWPGLAVVDADNGESVPNRSGFDDLMEVPGTQDELGRSSRMHGTITFDDMDEVARDFATVTNLLENYEPPADASDEDIDPRVTLVNHAFALQNRSGSSPLVDRYTPDVIPGLVGFDVGLRTSEPANVALEAFVEVLDVHGKRLIEEDSDQEPLPMPRDFVTVGG